MSLNGTQPNQVGNCPNLNGQMLYKIKKKSNQATNRGPGTNCPEEKGEWGTKEAKKGKAIGDHDGTGSCIKQ